MFVIDYLYHICIIICITIIIIIIIIIYIIVIIIMIVIIILTIKFVSLCQAVRRPEASLQPCAAAGSLGQPDREQLVQL